MRDTMLQVFAVFGVYDDPDGELEKRTYAGMTKAGGKGGKRRKRGKKKKGGSKSVAEASEELIRAKYGNPMVSRERRILSLPGVKKSTADMSNLTKLMKKEKARKRKRKPSRMSNVTKLMMKERERRRKKEEKEKQEENIAQYNKIGVANMEISTENTTTGKLRAPIERSVSFRLEETEPKKNNVVRTYKDNAKRIYRNLLKVGRRRNGYNLQYEEENYDSLVVIDEVRGLTCFRKRHLTNKREIEKRKLPENNEMVEFKQALGLTKY